MESFQKGDIVRLLDRPLGHPSKIKAVIIGFIEENLFSVIILNGMRKGDIKKIKSFEVKKENDIYEEN